MKPRIHNIKIDFEIPVSPTLKLPRFVYLFIIEGEKFHLIDTGVAAAFNKIEDYIKSIGRDLGELQNIFLTHSHPDHIGAAKLIQDKTNCKVFAPKAEKNWIEDTALQFQQRPVPGFQQLVAGDVKINSTIDSMNHFQIENDITIKSIPTPGHSAGSTSYLLQESNALFSGDAILLPGEIPIFENVQQYISSLDKICEMKPDVIYSSWDKPRFADEIPEILERSRKYILSIQQSAVKIAKDYKTPNSIDYCKAVLSNLGQNEGIANPLLLKSFLACLN